MHVAYPPQKYLPEHARPSMPVKTAPLELAHAEPSHPLWVGYVFWVFGFLGAHRFYYGKPITGTIWLLTGGLFLIGWIIDVFLIPSMAEEASRKYPAGEVDYSVAWALHLFLLFGLFGLHRFYMGKIFTGLLFLVTGGLFGLGFIYDTFTLNEQIDELNRRRALGYR
jgi:TM2 domain-containing membrane protein YozV